MVTKAEALVQAQELGIEGLTEGSGMSEIQAAVKAVTEGVKFSVSELMATSSQRFGQPRSVLVGAVSAGFVKDPSTVAAAEKGIAKFLAYSPGGED